LHFGYDLAECLTLGMPRSDNDTATWWFDCLPHTLVTVQGLRRAPEIGHLSAERASGDHLFALLDRLPEHTVLVMTLTFRPQDVTRNHIAQVRRAAVGDSAEAALTREGELGPSIQWTNAARRTTGHDVRAGGGKWHRVAPGMATRKHPKKCQWRITPTNVTTMEGLPWPCRRRGTA